MHRALLAFVVLSFSAIAETPYDHYCQLTGNWVSLDGGTAITYSVRGQQVLVQGESCPGSAITSSSCGLIDQSYRWDDRNLVRDYPSYGLQPVKIIELTSTKLVKQEENPLVSGQASVVSEELIDSETLKLTSEVRAGHDVTIRPRREIVLKRVSDARLQSADANNSAPVAGWER